MLNKYTRKKYAKSPREKHKENVRLISLCSTLTFVIAFIILLSGCSFFKDSKKYEMKKSPCACFDTKA